MTVGDKYEMKGEVVTILDVRTIRQWDGGRDVPIGYVSYERPSGRKVSMTSRQFLKKAVPCSTSTA